MRRGEVRRGEGCVCTFLGDLLESLDRFVFETRHALTFEIVLHFLVPYRVLRVVL